MPEEGLLSPRQISGSVLPHSFFSQILPSIIQIDELIALLHVYRACGRGGVFRPYFVLEAIESLLSQEELAHFRSGLEQAIDHGSILELFQVQHQERKVTIGLINGKDSALLHSKLGAGEITIPDSEFEISFEPPRLNIFKLYEANIGPLSPIIADALRELDQTYPADWIEEAISIAVRNNARKLRYIEAILQSWQEEGKHERTDKRRRKKTSEQFDPEGYTDGEYSDFLDY